MSYKKRKIQKETQIHNIVSRTTTIKIIMIIMMMMVIIKCEKKIVEED